MVTKGEGMRKEIGSLGWTCTYHYVLKWITNKDLLYSTGNSAQCYVAAWMVGEFEAGPWICVYVWLNPFAVHNIVNWLNCNIKLKIKKKKGSPVEC